MRCLVIPAGYVGGAFVGGLFVALSGGKIGSTIIAGGMTAALLLTLWYVVCRTRDVLRPAIFSRGLV
jgi:hypothetical protein